MIDRVTMYRTKMQPSREEKKKRIRHVTFGATGVSELVEAITVLA